MYTAPGNVLFDFGVPQPEIYHFGYSNCIFRRGSVYFPHCFPTLLPLSATSKSEEMSSAFSLPSRPQPGMKTQQVTAKNMNVHISTREQGEGRPKDKYKSNRLMLLLGKMEEQHSLSAVGIRHILHGDVYGSRWIYGLAIPRVMWPVWINQTPDRQQLVLLQIMFSPVCLQYL